LRSRDMTRGRAPLRPLLVKELWEILGGPAAWAMLLLVCPLVGYSFFQAVSLYAEASEAALQSPALASGLVPLDGILVPTFGAFYVAVTLLFPFVAIRVLGGEKESGALRLLVQLPYRPATLIGVKLAAILAAWTVTFVPVLSALLVWRMFGGHLALPETLNLILGHLLYGLLVGAIALFAAAVSDNAATAAILALAFTLGSWVLDFTLSGRPGLSEWIAQLSLTQTLRHFEQGLLSLGLVLGIIACIGFFAALATIWLPPGSAPKHKLVRSALCLLAVLVVVAATAAIHRTFDLTEDQRNSFAPADQRALAQLTAPLVVTARFSPEDPRYVDLRRNVLAKLERVMPNVTIRLVGSRQAAAASASDDAYGEVEYVYAGRSDASRSTSPREILPLLYGLAGVSPPAPLPGTAYEGYPLVADASSSLLWFFAALPLLIGFAWWWTRRPPSSRTLIHFTEVQR